MHLEPSMSQNKEELQNVIDQFFETSAFYLNPFEADKSQEKIRSQFRFHLLLNAESNQIDFTSDLSKLMHSDGRNYLGFIEEIAKANGQEWAIEEIAKIEEYANNKTLAEELSKQLDAANNRASNDEQDLSGYDKLESRNQKQDLVNSQSQLQSQSQSQFASQHQRPLPLFIDKQGDEYIQSLLKLVGTQDQKSGQVYDKQQIGGLVASYIESIPSKPLPGDPQYEIKLERFNTAKAEGKATREDLGDTLYQDIESLTPGFKAFEINVEEVSSSPEYSAGKPRNIYLPRRDAAGEPIRDSETGAIIQDILIIQDHKIVGAHIFDPQDQMAVGPETYAKIPHAGLNQTIEQKQGQGLEQTQQTKQAQKQVRGQEMGQDQAIGNRAAEVQSADRDLKDADDNISPGDLEIGWQQNQAFEPPKPEQVGMFNESLKEIEDTVLRPAHKHLAKGKAQAAARVVSETAEVSGVGSANPSESLDAEVPEVSSKQPRGYKKNPIYGKEIGYEASKVQQASHMVRGDSVVENPLYGVDEHSAGESQESTYDNRDLPSDKVSGTHDKEEHIYETIPEREEPIYAVIGDKSTDDGTYVDPKTIDSVDTKKVQEFLAKKKASKDMYESMTPPDGRIQGKDKAYDIPRNTPVNHPESTSTKTNHIADSEKVAEENKGIAKAVLREADHIVATDLKSAEVLDKSNIKNTTKRKGKQSTKPNRLPN